MKYTLRDAIRLGTLFVGKEPQDIVKIDFCRALRRLHAVWIFKG